MIRLPVLSRWHCNLLPRALGIASKSSVPDVVASERDLSDILKASELENVTSNKNITQDRSKHKLVAQVFENLNAPASVLNSHPSQVEKNIKEAKDVESLLKIASTPNLSRKSALTLLSTFGDWTAEKKINLKEFESDRRFIQMCRILGQQFKKKNLNGIGDLDTVLRITGDDEAAKLINDASLSQMVRILEKLSSKKKRSIPLLRSLSYNISKSEEKLNIKQCSDVLYAMANLSFHDEVLLVKTCADAYSSLSENTKSSVVGSIARSIGILRFRDTNLLDKLAEWTLNHKALVRPQDTVSLLMALATVYYYPNNADDFFKLTSSIQPLDLPSPGLFLDAVWSLVLLEKQTNAQLAYLFSDQIIQKIITEDGGTPSISTKLKYLNVNAAVKHIVKNYKGPSLNSQVFSKPDLKRSKEKTALVNCVMESLENLLPGENFMKKDVSIQSGFLIDGECLIGENYTPLPLSSKNKGTRVAIMVLGYHDTCVGARFQPNGVQMFTARILNKLGYKVLTVLHSEFSPSSKLVQRVQYLEQKLKALVSR